MKFISYIKDKIFSIILFLLNNLLIFFLLRAFKINVVLIILIITNNIFIILFLLVYNYLKKKQFYDNITNSINKLDKKYYVLEMLPNPITYEAKIMVNILYDINKSMIENVKYIEENVNSYKEFVELWVHEVKIPISSLVLKCHNNKGKYNDEFLREINRLDNYVDQVLYYVRSEESEKDFLINEVKINDVVKKVVLKNKSDLLDNNIEIKTNVDNLIVSTDGKWMEYIINQIVNNSIKYKREKNSVIKIQSEKKEDKIILSVYDNGIGIPKKDIKNIFNKSFTGSNGRNKTKSTGMGLYIVNNLIKKLGHKLLVESIENEYTKISIVFSINNFYKM